MALVEGGQKHGFQFFHLGVVVGSLEFFQQLALLRRQLGPECASDFITDLAALGKVGFRIVFFQ